ncbi:MAG TPA: hypothetical protein VGB17_03215 [Pyrinomonadaceae bacterium]|jgi:hypothetical protein
MKRVIRSWLLMAAVCLSAQAQQSKSSSTPAPVTGHYSYRRLNISNSLDVLLLPGGKIKFQLIALLLVGQGARNGEVRGIVTLENGRAVYDEGGCRVRLKFTRNKVYVSAANEDACGFGAYVTANGTYLKRNSRRPRFDF